MKTTIPVSTLAFVGDSVRSAVTLGADVDELVEFVRRVAEGARDDREREEQAKASEIAERERQWAAAFAKVAEQVTT